jgi:hypothetical protein
MGTMMRKGSRSTLLVLALAVWSAAGCQGQLTTQPSPTYCDGIDASLGGCAEDRPAYAGTDCAAVGHEFGRQLNDRLLPIFSGPDVVDQQSKAVRANHVTTVALSLANLHLRESGIVGACTANAFIAAAEQEFGAGLKAEAGKYLHDGPAVSYEEWLANLTSIAQLIDLDEGASSAP